jgi:hypothetical protein
MEALTVFSSGLGWLGLNPKRLRKLACFLGVMSLDILQK